MESIAEILSQNKSLMGNFEKLKKETLANPEIAAFIDKHQLIQSEIDRSVPKFYEYAKEREKFLNGEQSAVKGYEPVLVMNQGYADVTYRETAELVQMKRRRETYDVLMRDSLIPDEDIEVANFKSFIAEPNSKEREALEFAVNIAKRYLAGEQFTTVFGGEVGVGKSHLAISILKFLNEQALKSGELKRYLFVSMNRLFDDIKAHEFKNQDDWVTKIKSADMVVFDDLGRESSLDKQAGDWAQRLIFQLFDNKQPKIITTNLTDRDMAFIYNKGNASRILKNSKGNEFAFVGMEDKRR